MRHYAAGHAAGLVALLAGPAVSTVLDVGGGAGAVAIAFAARCPGLRATVYDKSHAALQIAEEDSRRAGVQDRVAVKQGDFFTDDLGRDYDLALLSHVLALFGPEEDIALLRRVKDALRPGGRVVVCDALVDASMTAPLSAAIFGVHMLVTSATGGAHPAHRVKRWLAQAGFKDVHALPHDGSTLLIGLKAADRAPHVP
jgi:tRNA A58 N-methylase Trm61